MGCDIHLHQEVKINGEWHHYRDQRVGRDYQLFGRMAGVRDRGITPLAEPRGFPDDATTITRLDYQQWGTDAHTPSWLNAQELYALEVWCQERRVVGERWSFGEPFGWLFGNSWGGFTESPDDNPPWLEDIRFVFWFDN